MAKNKLGPVPGGLARDTEAAVALVTKEVRDASLAARREYWRHHKDFPLTMAMVTDLLQWRYNRRNDRMHARVVWPDQPAHVELASLLVQEGSHFEEALRHPEGLPLLLASCVQGAWKARYYEYFLAKL